MILERDGRDDISNERILVLDGQLLSGTDRSGGSDGDEAVALGHVVAAVGQAAVVQQGEEGAEAVAGSLALRLVEGEGVCAGDGQQKLWEDIKFFISPL